MKNDHPPACILGKVLTINCKSTLPGLIVDPKLEPLGSVNRFVLLLEIHLILHTLPRDVCQQHRYYTLRTGVYKPMSTVSIHLFSCTF